MARSVEYWYNLMIAEKQTFNELNGLLPIYNLVGINPDNPFASLLNKIVLQSQTNLWELQTYIYALAIYTLDRFWGETKEEQEALAAKSIVANTAWYAAQVKLWQYGYALILNPDNFRVYYADTTSADAIASRLVKQVAVVERYDGTFNGVVFKVRGENGPLDTTPGTEQDSLNFFIKEIKAAGVQHMLVNMPSDKLRLNIKRYYDGTLILNDFKAADEAAINSFLANIQFDGVFHINQLIDALQLVPGSKAPWATVISAYAKADTDVAFTLISESYSPVSGWLELVPIGNTVGVDTTIEYIAI